MRALVVACATAAAIVAGLTLWLTLADAPYRPGWWP